MDEKVLAKKDDTKRLRSVTRKGIVGGIKRRDTSVGNYVKEWASTDEESIQVGGGKSKGEVSTAETSKPRGGVEMKKGEKAAMAKVSMEEQNADDAKTPIKRKRGGDEEIARAFMSSPDTGSSRLRPRKEVPSFRMVELNEDDSERIVGMRVKVYWSGSRKWFVGSIKSFDGEKGLHRINYEDGDKEELDLRQEKFELEIKPSDGFKLRTEPHSKKKVEGFDGDKVSAEILLKDVKREDMELLNRISEPKKSKASKKAAKGRSSKSQVAKDSKDKKVEDLFSEKDVDMLPEKVNEAIPDEVHDVEKDGHASFGHEHGQSRTIAEIPKECKKYSRRPATKTDANSHKPILGSNDCEESRIATKVVSDGTSAVSLDLPPTKTENGLQQQSGNDETQMNWVHPVKRG